MNHSAKIRNRTLMVMAMTAWFFCGPTSAQDSIEFGPQQAQIKASIKYTVIGKYVAGFKEFKGMISLDPQTGEIRSVVLEIDARSIYSNCETCDTIVRSRQLLDTERFESITFKSSEIIHDKDGYQVKGILDLHGVQKEMSFPFEVQMASQPGSKMRSYDISGSWVINRKEFGIIWNKLLDKGGVLVGNHITVKWGIKTVI